MNLIITPAQARELRNLLAREIKEQSAHARINGWEPPAALKELRELFVELHKQITGDEP